MPLKFIQVFAFISSLFLFITEILVNMKEESERVGLNLNIQKSSLW